MLSQKDEITTLEGATIQHGPLSRRIYLMKTGDANPPRLIAALNRLAGEQGYTKIFAKVPESLLPPFLDANYRIEAAVPRLIQGRENACFLGRYLSPDRQTPDDPDHLDNVLALARRKASPAPLNVPVPAGFTLRRCTSEDVNEMSAVYSKVFPSYPFPIDDPAYLLDTMRSHIEYFSVQHEGKLVALSSAETDKTDRCVEMTDFATLPDWRGHGLATCLLSSMEQAMSQAGFATACTIARASSEGMNITFARMGYRFAGRLVNNTNISGKIESMNVWHKSLDDLVSPNPFSRQNSPEK